LRCRVGALQPRTSKTHRVGDHRHRAQAHCSAGNDRAQEPPEEGVKHTGGDGNAGGVVNEGEEKVLPNVAHHHPAQAKGFLDAAQVVLLRCCAMGRMLAPIFVARVGYETPGAGRRYRFLGSVATLQSPRGRLARCSSWYLRFVVYLAAISTGGDSPGRGLVSALFTFVPRRRGVARRSRSAHRITSRCGDGSKRYAPELRRCLRRTFGRDPTGERAKEAEQFGGFLLGSGIKCKSFCNAIAQYAVPSRSDLTANDIRVGQRHRFNLPHDPAFGVGLRFGV
jgi:hypothetical protein